MQTTKQMCLKCFEPRCQCNVDKAEIDIDIYNTIQTLNKKGYYTLYCCSGHVNENTLFDKQYQKENYTTPYVETMPYVFFMYRSETKRGSDLPNIPPYYDVEECTLLGGVTLRGKQIEALRIAIQEQNVQQVKDINKAMLINLNTWANNIEPIRRLSYKKRVELVDRRNDYIRETFSQDWNG